MRRNAGINSDKTTISTINFKNVQKGVDKIVVVVYNIKAA